jgi:error-prone DNA polymerase
MAGAFTPWYSSRRDALWQLSGFLEEQARGPLAQAMPTSEPQHELRALDAAEETGWDLRTTGIAPKYQPIVHLRPYLRVRNILSVAAIAQSANGAHVRAGGVVITRQRPGTAKGFVFLTIEDETGLLNIIVRPQLYAQERRLIHEQRLLGIAGKLQNEGGVVHLVAQTLFALHAAEELSFIPARNFH